jgi:hypothetical protein
MKRILILSANPKNTTPLRLDEEMREIKFYSILMSTLIREFLCESFAKIILTPKLSNFCD